MSEQEESPAQRELLNKLFTYVEQGMSVHSSMVESGMFPEYVLHMVELGEYTGRLDSVFFELSHYCRRRAGMARALRSAVTSPMVFLIGMLLVLAVLIIKVLPIFANVLAQLGGTLSPIALNLMSFGDWLVRNRFLLLVAVSVVAIPVVVSFILPPWRKAIDLKVWGLFSKTRTGKAVLAARFSSAMAMVLSGGIHLDSAFEMIQQFFVGSAGEVHITRARAQLMNGVSFSDAVAGMGLLNPMYCKMLAVASKTGNVDTVMSEIAERSEEDMYTAISKLLGTVEPTIVAVMSGVVGIILASVLLPLLGIMSVL